MNGTFFTSLLGSTETTAFEPCVGIFDEFAILIIHTIQPQRLAAIELNHFGYHTLLTFNTAFHHFTHPNQLRQIKKQPNSCNRIIAGTP